jgi:hypothetical protein
MNERCIVLGAGFSKSIANLPTTIDLLNAFNNVKITQENLGHTNRVSWGEEIFKFINYLQKFYLDEPYSRAEKDGRIITANYYENFEALCSLIDLNLQSEVHALSESDGQKSDLSGKPLFLNKTISQLKQIRGWIGTYMKLALISAEVNEIVLDKFYNQYLDNSDSVITFNYDLIIEKYLYFRSMWLPKDGYGFNIENIPKVSSKYNNTISRFQVLKMHGSLNWKTESLYNNGFELEWFDDNNNYYFPNYLAQESKRPFDYQGAFSTDSWVYPSWIKQFTFHELLQVWHLAAQKFNNAKEIVFIGYSLPKEDSTVYSFISALNTHNKKILIINPNADEVVDNYSLLFPIKNIEIIPTTLENHLG